MTTHSARSRVGTVEPILGTAGHPTHANAARANAFLKTWFGERVALKGGRPTPSARLRGRGSGPQTGRPDVSKLVDSADGGESRLRPSRSNWVTPSGDVPART